MRVSAALSAIGVMCLFGTPTSTGFNPYFHILPSLPPTRLANSCENKDALNPKPEAQDWEGSVVHASRTPRLPRIECDEGGSRQGSEPQTLPKHQRTYRFKDFYKEIIIRNPKKGGS